MSVINNIDEKSYNNDKLLKNINDIKVTKNYNIQLFIYKVLNTANSILSLKFKCK